MSITKSFLLRMFGHPSGVLGRLGGLIMARTNRKGAAWVSNLLDVRPNERVLEIGFGPGVGIELLACRCVDGYIAGVDPSLVMVEQAKARNASSIETGRVDLRCAPVDSLPFQDNTFDKALAINSMQVWPDVPAGLGEIRRVMKPGGRIALGFTPYSGQSKDGLPELLAETGFIEIYLMEGEEGFCVQAVKPY